MKQCLPLPTVRNSLLLRLLSGVLSVTETH